MPTFLEAIKTQTEPQPVRIERCLNSKEVHVFNVPNNLKPALLELNFTFLASKRCFVSNDVKGTWLVLQSLFDVDLPSDMVEPPTLPISQILPDFEVRDPKESDEYKKFKAQVDALSAHFELDHADLLLKVIDIVHTQTFK